MAYNKRTLATGTMVAVLLVGGLVAMRAAQSVDDSPAPMIARKHAQLAALDRLQQAYEDYAGAFNPREREPTLRDSGRNAVGLFIENTYFRIAGEIAFDTRHLSALLLPRKPAQPVIFDDPGSFVFQPLSGSVTMPPKALSALFKEHAQPSAHDTHARFQGSSPNTGGPENQLGPGDHIVASIVRKQRQRYRQLNQVWSERRVPAALADQLGTATPRDSSVNAVALAARNVDFHLDDGVGYHVRHLKATLEPVEAGEPVDFDDPEQYVIHILSGEVLIRPEGLDALFNNYLLTDEPRALSSVENHTRRGTLEVTAGARLFRFIPPIGGLPTRLSGPIKVADNNWLVYTPKTVSQFGIPLKSLLCAAQLSLATLTPFERPGVRLEGNQLLMNPETIFPPPNHKIDKLTDARLSDAGLTLTFGSDTSDAGYVDPPEPADSYIWQQSGDARFYSTLLVNSNLELISDSDAPLDFHLYHYRAQSAAGTIRSRSDGALIVRVPNTFATEDDQPRRHSGLPTRSATTGAH